MATVIINAPKEEKKENVPTAQNQVVYLKNT